MSDNDLIPIPLTTDFLIKAIFIKNKDIFGDMLNEVLELGLKEVNIEFENVELTIDQIKEKRKNVDIFTVINDKYLIDTEINKSRSKNILERNIVYAYKIRTLNINRGSKLKDINKYQVYQLNLNTYKTTKNDTLEEVGLCIGRKQNKILSKNPTIVIKNLEKYREMYYSGNREKKVVYLASLTAIKFSECESILRNNLSEKRIKKFIEEVMDMCKNRKFPEKWWTKEEEDKLVLEEARQDSYEEGISQGINYGISQGKTSERKTLIENMFKNGIDISLISKVTSVPVKQLKKIKTSLFL